MNKKILALAVGAALTVPMAASADVKWYGQLQAEIANESTSGSAATDGHVVQANNFYDGNTVEDNKRGRLGVVATEKLGNGLTAIAKFEWQVSTVAANVSDGNRESYVGLKGDFGTFTIGANKAPYKYTGGVKYDPFVTTNLEARRYGGMLRNGGNSAYGQNGFMQDSVSYKTPKMGGFTGWVAYVPDKAGNEKDVSASAMFKGGNFEVFVAYGKDDSLNEEATKVGGLYKMGDHKFKIQYEMLDDNGVDGNVLFLGYEGKFGNNVLVAQFGDGEYKTATKQDSTYYAIGVIHKMSKQTRLFAGYASTDVDNANGVSGANGERDVFSVGMRKDF